ESLSRTRRYAGSFLATGATLANGAIVGVVIGRHSLGPVNVMGAYANGCPGAPIKAQDEAKTNGLGEDGNTEWRPRTPVPFGLLPKTPIAALQSLAGRPARLRLCALR